MTKEGMAALASRLDDPRADVLAGAAACVLRDRNAAYGEPEDNFRRIGDMWSAYLWGRGLLPRGTFLEPYDVAMLCSYIKDGRIMQTPGVIDHWIDRAGYSACGWRCVVQGAGGNDATEAPATAP